MALHDAYQHIHNSLAHVGLAEYVEPYTHVSAVEALRLRHRPKLVRFLMIAESHVRKSESQFSGSGPGLIFNPTHPTPWWTDLLVPGFGGTKSRSPRHYREKCLARLSEVGFWVLDASILALSGYQKVDPNWEPRPFDDYSEQIVRDSWFYYNSAVLDSILQQPHKPVIVIYTRVMDMLGEQLGAELTGTSYLIKFRCRANSTFYAADSYRFGTRRFCEAAREAGMEECLKDVTG